MTVILWIFGIWTPIAVVAAVITTWVERLPPRMLVIEDEEGES